VTIGVDLGQRRDPTAIAVVELEYRPVDEDHHLVRALERLPLGMSYPKVAERIAEVCDNVVAWAGYQSPMLYVDATGVGMPVIDMLRTRQLNAVLRPVYFTHGDRRTEERGEVKLGKAFLVSRLQALLQSGRLHLPETSEARRLAKELLDYEIRVDQNANDTYGAFKVGSHDDLVTALGLSVQPVRTVRARAIGVNDGMPDSRRWHSVSYTPWTR
jgi:hypothetical protein